MSHVRAMFIFESLDTDDVLFVERVVECWGIRKQFTELAQEITPPDIDAAVICSVWDGKQRLWKHMETFNCGILWP